MHDSRPAQRGTACGRIVLRKSTGKLSLARGEGQVTNTGWRKGPKSTFRRRSFTGCRIIAFNRFGRPSEQRMRRRIATSDYHKFCHKNPSLSQLATHLK